VGQFEHRVGTEVGHTEGIAGQSHGTDPAGARQPACLGPVQRSRFGGTLRGAPADGRTPAGSGDQPVGVSKGVE
jgi:hypothetical protein